MFVCDLKNYAAQRLALDESTEIHIDPQLAAFLSYEFSDLSVIEEMLTQQPIWTARVIDIKSALDDVLKTCVEGCCADRNHNKNKCQNTPVI